MIQCLISYTVLLLLLCQDRGDMPVEYTKLHGNTALKAASNPTICKCAQNLENNHIHQSGFEIFPTLQKRLQMFKLSKKKSGPSKANNVEIGVSHVMTC
jgi:hypothetical protein